MAINDNDDYTLKGSQVKDLANEINLKIEADTIAPVSAVAPITTAMIQDGAVTSDKIDWSTIAPYWKVVSVANGNSLKVPAGYRYYRIYMACTASAPSSAARVFLAASTKSNTAYNTGTEQNSSTSVAPFAVTWGSSDNRVAMLTGSSVSSAALNVNIRMDLTRENASWDWLLGYYASSGSGGDWTMQGKVEMSTSASDFNLLFRRDGATISNCYGYVEALVES